MKISIWLFDEAPQKYQDMSRHGGDEDWVVVFHDVKDANVLWLPEPLGELCCEPDTYTDGNYVNNWLHVDRVRDGEDLVVITAHS